MVSGLLQVNNQSGWLQMENRGGHRTENDCGELQMENYYRWRTTVVGFKLKTLVGGELQVKRYGCRLQMKTGGCVPRRTTVESFRWRTKHWAIDGEQQWLASNGER